MAKFKFWMPVLLLGCIAAGCAGAGSADDTVVDMHAAAGIDSTLQQFVDSGDIAGVSALVFEKGEEVYFNAFGMADLENQYPMSRNSIIQIYSMTKPITGTALMQLYEQGAFDLDDPVSEYLPEFAEMQVYAGEDDAGNTILEQPRREMTIRDLTRHTAGFAPNGDSTGAGGLLMEADPTHYNNTLSEMGERLASVPLAYHPGERWLYGIAVDVQALLVERISEIPFEQYLTERIFEPLGMLETRYYVPESDRRRMTMIYNRDSETGTLEPVPYLRELNINQVNLRSGGYGLTSTLDDYMRFAQMLVNEGELDGVRILQPETVRLMATNHLSEDVTERSWLPSKGNVGFGINFAVRVGPPLSDDENYGVTGEYFWDGMASTLFWVDPVNDLTAILFVQLIPFDEIGLQKSFRNAVYGSYRETSNF